jgi:hypothetical protein
MKTKVEVSKQVQDLNIELSDRLKSVLENITSSDQSGEIEKLSKKERYILAISILDSVDFLDENILSIVKPNLLSMKNDLVVLKDKEYAEVTEMIQNA